MSITFWSVAAIMVLGATAAVVLPMRRAGARRYMGLIVAVFVPAAVVAIYLGLGEPRALAPSVHGGGEQGSGAPDMATMIERLEERLQERPEDREAWAMYGRALVSQGRYREAAEAWARRRELPGGDDPDVLANLAEARILAGGGPVSPGDRTLVEQALAAAPQHPKALWYGGVAARQAGERDLALERWRRLLALGPPESLARVLREQIKEMGGDTAGPSDASEIRIRVALAEGVGMPELGPEAVLFVFVRSVDGGPPLAVRRLPPELPVSLSLGPEDAMMGGSGPVTGQDVQVVARLSLDGDVSADAEDLQGRTAAVVGETDVKDIALEQRGL